MAGTDDNGSDAGIFSAMEKVFPANPPEQAAAENKSIQQQPVYNQNAAGIALEVDHDQGYQ